MTNLPGIGFLKAGLDLPFIIGLTTTFIDNSVSGPSTFTHVTTLETSLLIATASWTNGSQGQGHGAATFNGVAMTFAGMVEAAGGTPTSDSAVWYLFHPPVGSFTMSIDTNSNQRAILGVTNFSGLDTYTEFKSNSDQTGSASSLSITHSAMGTRPGIAIAVSGRNTANAYGTLTGNTLYNLTSTNIRAGASWISVAPSIAQVMTHNLVSPSGRSSMVSGLFYQSGS